MDGLNSLANKNFRKSNVTKDWLKRNNFNYAFSDNTYDAYTYRFPVYKNDIFIILECEIMIYEQNGEVRINVFDYKTRDKYAPFYYIEYGNYDTIIDKINKKILTELKRLGIKEIKKTKQ